MSIIKLKQLGYKIQYNYDTGNDIIAVALVLDDSETLSIKSITDSGKIEHYATYYVGTPSKW